MMPSLSLAFLPLLLLHQPAEEQNAGGKLLLEVGAALRNQDSLISDDVVLETTARGKKVTVNYRVVLGGNGTGTLERGPLVAVIEDDWASVSNTHRSDAYFVAEAAGENLENILGVFSPPTALLPHFSLRLAEEEQEAVDAFAFGWDDEVSVIDVTPDPNGNKHQTGITLQHTDGVEKIVIEDSSKKILSRSVHTDGSSWDFHHNIQRTGEHPRTFAFEADEKSLANDLLEIIALSQDEIAPTFATDSLDGETIDLETELEKGPVVLDFWATWCAPCRKGLKEVHHFAREAKKSDFPISIIAINVSEQMDRKDRIDAVREFWEKSGHDLAVAFDFDDTIRRSYGVPEIPVTMVLNRSGAVVGIFSEEGDETLGEWLDSTTHKAAENR